MIITFEYSLQIQRIHLSEKTLTLDIGYIPFDENQEYEWKENKLIFQSSYENKSIEISSAKIELQNIQEIWWDDWWDEDKERVALWSINLDNINWRFDELENLQYNAPKHDVDWNDLNDLNIYEWDTALWSSKIKVDSEDLSNCNYHLILDIPHDLIQKKNWSRQYKPLHIKGINMRIDIK